MTAKDRTRAKIESCAVCRANHKRDIDDLCETIERLERELARLRKEKRATA